MVGFGGRVREFRIKLGLTQSEFAAALLVTTQNVSNVESGQRGFSLKVLSRLRKLGADLNWLICGDEASTLE